MSARPKLRGGRGRPSKPKSDVARMLQDYFQPALHTTEFNALASGADIATTLVDNSSDFGGAVLKWSKLTIRPIWEVEHLLSAVLDGRTILMAIRKMDQDDTGAIALDNAQVIRELSNDKKLLRGPWPVTTPFVNFTTSGSTFIPAMGGHMKAIVLKDFVLDREEDLVISFTNVSPSAFGASAMQLDYFMKGYVRVIT